MSETACTFRCERSAVAAQKSEMWPEDVCNLSKPRGELPFTTGIRSRRAELLADDLLQTLKVGQEIVAHLRRVNACDLALILALNDLFEIGNALLPGHAICDE